MSYGSIYCRICGTSLRVLLPNGRMGSQIACTKRFCPTCHGLYCIMPGHALDTEKAQRVLERVRSLNPPSPD